MIEIALVALCAANVAAGIYLERLRAKERQFLINTALANNTYEFAVRQQATEPAPAKPSEPEDFDAFPEGLYN